MALIAVIMLTLGSLAMIASSLSWAISYADMVNHRELRIQKRLNMNACLEIAKIMVDKDYFIAGTIHLKDFDCDVF